jgi:hypothetical protein
MRERILDAPYTLILNKNVIVAVSLTAKHLFAGALGHACLPGLWL